MVVSFKGARCIIERNSSWNRAYDIDSAKKNPRILSFNVGQDINLLRWKSKLKFHFYKKIVFKATHDESVLYLIAKIHR